MKDRIDSICDRIFRQLDRIEYYSLLCAKSVLDINDAATVTGLSKSSIYKLCYSCKIPHYKRGKVLYFDKKELEMWLKEIKIGNFNFTDTTSETETTDIGIDKIKSLSLSRKEAQEIMISEIKTFANILKEEQKAQFDQAVQILINQIQKRI